MGFAEVGAGEEGLEEWTSEKYAILSVDVSTTHNDADLADIATHTDGSSFSWDEFDKIVFVTDLQHPVDWKVKINDPDNDAAPFLARGDSLERVLKIDSLYFTNSTVSTTGITDVIILLGGW